ncbi:MAG: TolC family protein [Rikenellaceae bacterium]
MKKILLALTAAVALSSCGLYSKYEGQGAVSENLYGSRSDEATKLLSRDTTNMMGNISWREIFTDVKLQRLIEQALEKNTNVRTAVLNVENAQTALKTARLAYMPSLAVSATGSVSGLLEGGGATKTYTVPLSAAWEVDIFGKLRNDKERAKMVAEQTVFVEQAVRAGVVSAVANLYYTLSLLDGQIEITTQTMKSWGESVTTAKAMKEAGYLNEAGVAQIEAGLLGVESGLSSLKEARKEAENALCSILATTPQSITVAPLNRVAIPERLSVGVPLQLLSSRPDVMAAEAALAASFYSENMARAAFYPSISLSGTLGWTNDIGVVVNPAEFIYSAVGSLVQPIFTRGLTRAQLDIAKRTFEQSRMSFEQTLLDSGIEVNSALAKLSYANGRAGNYTEQVRMLSRAEQSTKLLMEHGSTTYLEVLTAQQTLYSAQLQRVNNLYEQISAMVSLYSALGGGRF